MAIPPMVSLQKWLGLKPRPPHYLPFWQAFAVLGAWYGCVWGILMWNVTWSRQGLPLPAAFWLSFRAGALFGLLMASYYRWGRKRYDLSDWNEL
ncbi:DUF6404 family protein [Roseobacteraceae bacterium NS-SX3]